MSMTKEEARDAVRHPGKFEGEAAYVPYYWDRSLDGGSDEDLGSLQGFRLDEADYDVWPELEGRDWLWLQESGDGFVYESSCSSAPGFSAMLDEVMDSLF